MCEALPEDPFKQDYIQTFWNSLDSLDGADRFGKIPKD